MLQASLPVFTAAPFKSNQHKSSAKPKAMLYYGFIKLKPRSIRVLHWPACHLRCKEVTSNELFLFEENLHAEHSRGSEGRHYQGVTLRISVALVGDFLGQGQLQAQAFSSEVTLSSHRKLLDCCLMSQVHEHAGSQNSQGSYIKLGIYYLIAWEERQIKITWLWVTILTSNGWVKVPQRVSENYLLICL